MVYRIVVASNEVKGFRRDLLIDGSATFLELYQALTKTLHYSTDEPSLFRITDSQWRPKYDIHLVDMGTGRSDEEVYLMEDTYLEDFLDHEGDRLLYTFDMLGNRSLYMELREIRLGESVSEPKVVLETGEAPHQSTLLEELLEPRQSQKETTPKGTPESVDLIKEMGYDTEDFSEDELSDLDITDENDQ